MDVIRLDLLQLKFFRELNENFVVQGAQAKMALFFDGL